MTGRGVATLVTALAVAGALMIGAGSALAGGSVGSPVGAFPFGAGMMTGFGTSRAGMMGGWAAGPTSPAPGQAGFVAGTPAAPRVVRVVAGPGYAFTPSTVAVAKGETVTFAVTAMGPLVHEFMVGPAADVAADKDGTPEVADIAMMQTKTVTYTFDGSGPYAFACHAPGHYEAGMAGTIQVVG